MTDPAAARPPRWLYIALAAIGALLVGVIILLIVIVNQNAAAVERAEHERIVAICEGQYGDPYGDDMGEMLACIQELKK